MNTKKKLLVPLFAIILVTPQMGSALETLDCPSQDNYVVDGRACYSGVGANQMEALVAMEKDEDAHDSAIVDDNYKCGHCRGVYTCQTDFKELSGPSSCEPVNCGQIAADMWVCMKCCRFPDATLDCICPPAEHD